MIVYNLETFVTKRSVHHFQVDNDDDDDAEDEDEDDGIDVEDD